MRGPYARIGYARIGYARTLCEDTGCASNYDKKWVTRSEEECF